MSEHHATTRRIVTVSGSLRSPSTTDVLLAAIAELRPLFAFFRAATAPIGVYARPGDYLREAAGARVDPDGALPAAIARAVASVLPLLPRSVTPAP